MRRDRLPLTHALPKDPTGELVYGPMVPDRSYVVLATTAKTSIPLFRK